MTTRSPWIDRIAGAAVGAIVTALLLRPEVDPAPAPIEVASAAPAPAPTPEPAPTPAPEQEPAPEPAPEPEPEPETPEPHAADATTGEPAPATPEGRAPKIPLSRLPGTRTLRTSARFDPDLSAWVLTHSVQVPAPAAQVESFYRKALHEQGLKVTAFVEPVTDRWAVRVTVRGRGRKDKAQVSIRQPSGEMRTTARIIWEHATD